MEIAARANSLARCIIDSTCGETLADGARGQGGLAELAARASSHVVGATLVVKEMIINPKLVSVKIRPAYVPSSPREER